MSKYKMTTEDLVFIAVVATTLSVMVVGVMVAAYHGFTQGAW